MNGHALIDLATDVGPDVARSYFERVCSNFQPRLTRLARAVGAGDFETAHVTALSLHSAAAMVGADCLAATLARLIPALRTNDLSHATAVLPELCRQTKDAHAELAGLISGAGAPN